MMRTANPALNDNVFRGEGRAVLAGDYTAAGPIGIRVLDGAI